MSNEDEILARAGETPENLGRRVRAEWLAWATRQPDALEHPHWLLRYDALDPRDREVDDAIGTELFTAGWLAARRAYRPEAYRADTPDPQGAAGAARPPRDRVCVACEVPEGQPHQRWCPVLTGTLSSLGDADRYTT